MNNITRYNPDIHIGLTGEQLAERQKSGLINYDTSSPAKSVKQILKDNILTLFNLLNFILGLMVFCVGSYRNLLFLVIIASNTAISTIQELHSRRVVNKLSVIAQPNINVIRDGKKSVVSMHDLVLDDILELNSGDQIVTDAIIQQGKVQVNESFITGESDNVLKKEGDTLLSGSFVVSGRAVAKVEHIGEENYIAKIASKAKYVKKVNSEIMNTLNKIIKILSIAIVPIGILMFINHLDLPFSEAVVKTVAAIIGMIPEGLVLLTSTVLAVSVIKLAKSRVLVHDIYCIETLARVDTLCLDKTGTITEGVLEVNDVIGLTDDSIQTENILANIALASTDINATICAIRDRFDKPSEKYKAVRFVPFSSESKWSGVEFDTLGTYIIGAPEFVLDKKVLEPIQQQIDRYIGDYRVLVLAYSNNSFNGEELPSEIKALALILISDKIRKEAPDTLRYFKKQGVDIKIISGDNPETVAKIANRAGVDNADNFIDASTLSTDKEIADAVKNYTVFGRVKPEQKKAIISALKAEGKTVAMTGDGVNDVLALKEADCSIAMAQGNDACKSVSMLVLLDSNFASMPKIVDEGRQTINNIQRSASLFLTKTIFSTLLSIIFLITMQSYPFIPIQLSLVSTFVVAIPSFFLALEPNKERITGKFLFNIISRAIPSAFSIVTNVVLLTALKANGIISPDIYSTLCVLSVGTVGIIMVFVLARRHKGETFKLPFSPYRFTIACIALVLFMGGVLLFSGLFMLNLDNIFLHFVEITSLSIVTFTIFYMLSKLIFEKLSKRKD